MAKFGQGQPGNPNGRPGKNRPHIRDFFSKEEITKLVEDAKTRAAKGDKDLMKFLLEQIFGKAPQNIELPEGSSGQITVTWDKS